LTYKKIKYVIHSKREGYAKTVLLCGWIR